MLFSLRIERNVAVAAAAEREHAIDEAFFTTDEALAFEIDGVANARIDRFGAGLRDERTLALA